MNMRHLRRYHNFQTARNLYFGPRFTSITVKVTPMPLVQVFREAAGIEPIIKDTMGKSSVHEVEPTKVEYMCVKAKDGSVVNTFSTIEDAWSLVEKHARQKKAKLNVMNSATGELVPIEETA